MSARAATVLELVVSGRIEPRLEPHSSLKWDDDANFLRKEAPDMGIAEIESAITQLPAKVFAESMAWLQEYHGRVWDKQIEGDLAAERLDALMTKTDEEYRQGQEFPAAEVDAWESHDERATTLPAASM
jgi:hypothetical protein